MIVRLAVRTLLAHPVRSGLLAAGFGLGVAVMAILLGVADVVLDQARSPALVGGGDVLVHSTQGPLTSARLLLNTVLRTPPLSDHVVAASPWARGRLYLIGSDGRSSEVRVRAGIPSLERAAGDPETLQTSAWVDSPGDGAWTSANPEELLRQVDRFHPIPDVPARATSWAEWLYFNGRSTQARFYLTFLVGPARPDGRRVSSVRLQLDRGRGLESFGGSAALAPGDVEHAPELTIAGSRIRLRGMTYDIALDLKDSAGRRATGSLELTADPARLVPPLEVQGAAGWRTGYVVPVISGRLKGALTIHGQHIAFDDGVGYHDHNWGFWKGVSWQWGQVQHGNLSLVYGRIFPPPDAADRERMPGFLGIIGPEGPLGYATNVNIEEQNQPGSSSPKLITITARSAVLDLRARFSVTDVVTNRVAGPLANDMDFLQMRGVYAVQGTAAGQKIDFETQGSAETFR